MSFDLHFFHIRADSWQNVQDSRLTTFFKINYLIQRCFLVIFSTVPLLPPLSFNADSLSLVWPFTYHYFVHRWFSKIAKDVKDLSFMIQITNNGKRKSTGMHLRGKCWGKCWHMCEPRKVHRGGIPVCSPLPHPSQTHVLIRSKIRPSVSSPRVSTCCKLHKPAVYHHQPSFRKYIDFEQLQTA